MPASYVQATSKQPGQPLRNHIMLLPLSGMLLLLLPALGRAADEECRCLGRDARALSCLCHA